MKIEMEDIRALSPGHYAFLADGKVAFLEFEETPNDYIKNSVRFSISRLGAEEERIIESSQITGGISFEHALSNLRFDNQMIISEFASKQRFLREGEIAQVA
jgi:hypothetical protein